MDLYTSFSNAEWGRTGRGKIESATCSGWCIVSHQSLSVGSAASQTKQEVGTALATDQRVAVDAFDEINRSAIVTATDCKKKIVST